MQQEIPFSYCHLFLLKTIFCRTVIVCTKTILLNLLITCLHTKTFSKDDTLPMCNKNLTHFRHSWMNPAPKSGRRSWTLDTKEAISMSVGNDEPTSAYPFMPLTSIEFWKVNTTDNVCHLLCLALHKRNHNVFNHMDHNTPLNINKYHFIFGRSIIFWNINLQEKNQIACFFENQRHRT